MIVQLKKGDTLVRVANKYLKTYSQWREIAQINELDIFDDLPVGKNIKIPDREELKKLLDKRQAEILASTQKDVKARLTEIAVSRELRSIAKTLGVDTTKLIKDLDLSPLAKKLPNASNSVDEVWNLANWIL
ncbi:LysM peptidoglycan-binding domain-containing protein [Anabaena sp. CCY 9402-a]|uniref:LysM peptidoglycan-binding domain-containing protein n=1 Tax=Anabaena sp. CCY 9402-a TaxID=3103867 RepID=UPI0039C62753